MSTLRKVLNGILLFAFLCIIAGMITWGILSHDDHKPNNRNLRKAEEEKLIQAAEEESNITNLGLVKGCNGPSWRCSLRLDPAVIPKHYELYINPNFQTGIFTGRVKINITLKENREHIRLHMKDLDILNTTVTRDNGTVHNINAFDHAGNEYWVIDHIVSNQMFEKGDYILQIEFKGDMTKRIVGIYRAAYFDKEANETKYVVSTKFQPTYARRAFPCFDEPGFKSTFSLRVVRPRNLTCISNMPIYSEEINTPEPGYTTVFFNKSFTMVTYLVAFAIGDFESRNGTTSKGRPVSVYATKPLAPHVEYAASIAPKMVEFYEDYFNVSYPLPKLDIVGIPEFISGAMEHWGMISFRESNLVYTPGMSSAYNKKRVAAVVAHEIAHMWFGNLMTLAWWNDLWLNEGFASYMEYKGVNHVHPEWKINWQFLSDDFANTLRLDAKMSSHPIVQAVAHPNQITELFDTISYNKGATVIRMLEDFLGPEAFRSGVSAFLKRFSYANAVTKDLWDSLQNETDDSVDVNLIMSTWTKQMGYPYVTPTVLDGKTIRFTQERFHENKFTSEQQPDEQVSNVSMASASPPSPFNYTWEIPLKIEYQTLNGTNKTELFWMHHTESELDVDLKENFTWFKVNPGYFGLYRVNYNENDIREIREKYIQHWSVPDKCGTARDLFSLANGNYSEFSIALEFAQILEGETEFLLWDCVDGHLKKIGKLLRKTSLDTYNSYKLYMQKLLKGAYIKLQWRETDEGEDIMKRLSKPKIISLACEYDLNHCRDEASKLLSTLLESPANVSGGLRDVIYKWGLRQATDITWNRAWERYLQEQDPQERVRLLRGLANTKNTKFINKLLEQSQNDTVVRRQDYFSLLKFISSNPFGMAPVWEFYKNNYQSLLDRFGLDNRSFGRLIQDLTSDFSSENDLKDVYSLFKKYPNGGAGTNARKFAVENIKNNINWRSQNSPKVEDWLSKNFFEAKNEKSFF